MSLDAIMTAEELNAFLLRAFPLAGGRYLVEELTADGIVVRYRVQDTDIRPGNTISGPAMFSTADVGMYAAILARIGPKALAVTTNCSIDFMRKPEAGRDLIGHVRLLKLGRQLAVGDVLIHSEGQAEPVARASLTYAIPPKGSAADVDG